MRPKSVNNTVMTMRTVTAVQKPRADPRSDQAVSHWEGYYTSSKYRTFDRGGLYAEIIRKNARAGSAVIDAPSGFGFLLKHMRDIGLDAYGLDLHALRFAATTQPHLPSYLVVGDITTPPS